MFIVMYLYVSSTYISYQIKHIKISYVYSFIYYDKFIILSISLELKKKLGVPVLLLLGGGGGRKIFLGEVTNVGCVLFL